MAIGEVFHFEIRITVLNSKIRSGLATITSGLLSPWLTLKSSLFRSQYTRPYWSWLFSIDYWIVSKTQNSLKSYWKIVKGKPTLSKDSAWFRFNDTRGEITMHSALCTFFMPMIQAMKIRDFPLPKKVLFLSLIHIWRCRRSTLCRSRWSPYH